VFHAAVIARRICHPLLGLAYDTQDTRATVPDDGRDPGSFISIRPNAVLGIPVRRVLQTCAQQTLGCQMASRRMDDTTMKLGELGLATYE
jgi:hypothetical protein